MIKSKKNTLFFWITSGVMIIAIWLLLSGLRTAGSDRQPLLILSSILLVPNLLQLWMASRKIMLNAAEGTITFTHLFTRKRVFYHLTDFDGYVDMIEDRPRGGPFRVLYLVRDGKFIQRIPSSIYSNIDEIEGGLKPTKYIGQQEFSWLKRVKILLGRRVLDTPP